jgi:hypothetical protein
MREPFFPVILREPFAFVILRERRDRRIWLRIKLRDRRISPRVNFPKNLEILCYRSG